MEAMDTDEGQRTTARLLEEACHLSTAAMEPPYATIDETMSATLQGSEAAISDILATQDPQNLNKSETGEKSYSSRNEGWFTGRMFQSTQF